MARLRVLSVASEVYPLIKTGGLADVVGALPLALAREDIAVRTLVPGYPQVLAGLPAPKLVCEFPELGGGPARLLSGEVAGLDVLAIDAPHLYTRPGNPYLGPDGRDWPDNGLRFAALAQCAATIALGGVAGDPPDIVHAHDWQAGLAPAYLHYAAVPRPRTVMTVHNLSFQGLFPRDLLPRIGLPRQAWSIDGVEFHGKISFMKAGLGLSDLITTVSPTYAAEIRTPHEGMGMDGLLRMRAGALHGIRNGIDEDIWNPATDPLLSARYDAQRLALRRANKAELQVRMGLALEPDALLFGVVSRLTAQKGLDLLHDSLPSLLDVGAQLALLGNGDRVLERKFVAAAERHPGRIAVNIGYDESLAHLLQGSVDALLVPSRFEPCGLTQLYALRYGAIPVVARVGGLADTVIDANDAALSAGVATGVQFAPVTTAGIEIAIERTRALWRNRKAWQRMQMRAMAADVSWRQPARRYAELYRELVASNPR